MDETLIHSSFDPRKRLSIQEPRLNCTFEFRPFLKEFLLKCNEHFEIVIFTAGEDAYANTLVNRIKELCNYRINIKKILDRKFINSAGQKDLSIIKDRELKDIIFIDNLALSFAKDQLDNGIPIFEWTGDSRDKELKKILPFLSHCAKSNDVREPIKERFNLEDFINQPIQWGNVDADIYRAPIWGYSHL